MRHNALVRRLLGVSLTLLLGVLLGCTGTGLGAAESAQDGSQAVTEETLTANEADVVAQDPFADPATAAAVAAEEDAHHLPAVWSVIPFAVLLLCIAVCPLVVPHFWHHHYPKVAIALGLITGAYYLIGLHDYASLVHVGFEYLAFIALLSSLFVSAGGIVIDVDKKATPLVNVIILAIGAVIANLIGTTGAAMLLIRPFMRVNKGRLKPFHIVFFIFIVANVGGSLTPIGDPPLFLGFLKGIDFFLFFELNFAEWSFALALLLGMFVVLDLKSGAAQLPEGEPLAAPSGKVAIRGGMNFVFLAVVIGAVFCDPNKMPFLPTLADIHHGEHYAFGIKSAIAAAHPELGSNEVTYFSFVREIIMFAVAFLAFKFARRENLEANGFNFEPIKEVGYLFIGIFLTMVPALALIKAQAVSGSLFGLPLTATTFYFGTGALSGVLDNAPTFLSFLAGLEGKVDMNAGEISSAILQGGAETAALAKMLAACAVASVFWGAFTYIGNGPNFMVKAIAESARDQHGEPVVRCPSFFGYVIGYSIPFLLPVLILTWVVFFSGWVF